MEKILIVDDSSPDRELLKAILSNSKVPYEITMAENGIGAMEEINKNPPDIVILDIQMNEMNGFETLKQINSKDDYDIPVLLISSFTHENDRIKGLELGATDFITKPIIPEEVLARIAVQMKIRKMSRDAHRAAEDTNRAMKLLYKELEKKNEKLKEIDQLKSDFVSTVSHELRTPLAIIRQGVSLMHRKILGELSQQQQEALTDILENVDRLITIINGILDMSKLEAGKMELNKSEADVSELIEKLVKDFQIKANQKEISLTCEIEGVLPLIYIDRDKAIQVLTNLIGNALKFTSPKGYVTVTAQEKDNMIQIAVADNGEGISQENISKLFGKFQQFNRTNGPGERGTGLGLAISKEIVHLHNGRIWAESQPGKGSVFYFSLPIDVSSEG